jgi:hypothetical protein
MDARETIRAYYDALRAGEPLGGFFAAERPGDDAVVKFGISERLVGAERVREGLQAQTERTTDWAVTSESLRVTERESHAWFSDRVTMGWLDAEAGVRYEFDTRWSGTLERGRRTAGESDDSPGDWRFVLMHVSTAEAF